MSLYFTPTIYELKNTRASSSFQFGNVYFYCTKIQKITAYDQVKKKEKTTMNRASCINSSTQRPCKISETFIRINLTAKMGSEELHLSLLAQVKNEKHFWSDCVTKIRRNFPPRKRWIFSELNKFDYLSHTQVFNVWLSMKTFSILLRTPKCFQ